MPYPVSIIPVKTTRSISSPSSSSSSRRSAAGALLLAVTVVLAGCSGTGEGAGSRAGDTRTITDALGEVTVPVEPERVVSTDFFSSSVLVDVGITPVGVMEGVAEPDSRPDRYVETLGGVEQLSTYAEIDVEKVAQLDPDLIIVDAEFPEPETLERLETIAPLFHVDLSGDWADRALSIADGVGRLDEAEAQQRDYRERADAVSEEYRDVLDATPLAIVSINTTENTWASYAPGGWPTPVWMDVGATFRTPTQGEADTADDWAWVSDEELSKLDNAGMIIVLEKEQLARYADNPAWKQLPAVRKNRVFTDFPSPATSSFRWGMDNLDSVETILSEVRDA